MPKSPAFARIKKEILAIVEAIPAGRISTYKAIGDALQVQPRHVAYILTTLSEIESEQLPWQRVVADGGKISAPKLFDEQVARLQTEGVRCEQGQVAEFEVLFIAPAEL
jgi:methylated-DNA-protein-cysteine methyltransferase related protein